MKLIYLDMDSFVREVDKQKEEEEDVLATQYMQGRS